MADFYLPEGTSRVVVSCSDRRLSAYLDSEFNDGKTAFVRTAGADVTNIADTLVKLVHVGTEEKNRAMRQVVVLTHTDMRDVTKGCGWAGRLAVEEDARLHGKELDSHFIGDAQISQFIENGYTSREQIEKGNKNVQKKALDRLMGSSGVSYSTDTIDTSVIPTENELEHVLVITRPSVARYSDMAERLNKGHGSMTTIGKFNAYYSQVGTFEEALVDARLFTGALGIHDVRVLAQDQHDNELMRSWAGQLHIQDFMKNVKLTLVITHGNDNNKARLRA